MENSIEKSTKPNYIKITFTGTYEELEPYVEQAYRKNKGRFSIPGFRKGKAPRKMIELNYGEEVFHEDAINELMNEQYPLALKEHELEPVDYPEVDIEKFSKEEGLVFVAEVAVKPEVTLGDYKGLSVEKESADVPEEDVDKVIEQQRQKNARMAPVDREIKEEDVAIIDLKVLQEGEEVESFTFENRSFTVGKNFLPKSINEALVGMKAEEEKSFTGNISSDEEKEEMADIELKVLEVKEKQLPELDDDFAVDVSDFDTMEEYRADVRKTLEEDKKKYVDQKYKRDLLDKAMENMEVEVHPVMIEDAKDRIFSNYQMQIEQQGIPMDQYLQLTGMTKESIKEQMTEDALQHVREDLFMEALIKMENVEATDEDVENKIKELAELTGSEEEQIREIYSINDYGYMKEEIQREKALELLVENAK